MATQMLCGDEVQSAVVDIGNAFSKFGDGGQELPRHCFRSDLGRIPNNKNYIISDSNLRHHMKNSSVEICKPFENGGIDWNAVEQILSHGLGSMRANASQYPILFAESYFQSPEDKAKLSEIVFETIGSPAMFVCSNATLASFSAGRPSSLVIDCGASKTAVHPVVDGYKLAKASVYTTRGGDVVDEALKTELTEGSGSGNIQLSTWHDRQTKLSSTSLNKKSLTHLFVNDVIRDLKLTMSFIPYKPISVSFNNSETDYMKSLIIPHYELPDGTVVSPRYPLCSIPEKVYFPTRELNRKRARQDMIVELYKSPYLTSESNFYMNDNSSNSNGNSNPVSSSRSKLGMDDPCPGLPLHHLVMRSLSFCDVDVRRDLLNNIILVGGCSLTDGLAQRLTYELTELLPVQFKMKMVATVPIEKHYGVWIGGSILSICGTFQQSWVSRQDYLEFGGANIARNFEH